MLHVTSTTMKKIAIIISTLALFIFVAAGCKNTYRANPDNNNTVVQEDHCPDNASCKVLPDKSMIINYKKPIALSDAIDTLPSGYGVSRITAMENDHSFTVAYSETLLDLNQLIAEYEYARNENLEDLIEIQSDTLDRRSTDDVVDHEYLAVLQDGIDKLAAIKMTIATPSLNIKDLLAKEL